MVLRCELHHEGDSALEFLLWQPDRIDFAYAPCRQHRWGLET